MKKIFLKAAIYLTAIAVTVASSLGFSNVSADSNIRLVVNGNDITELSAPVIENDRTLVPIRFVTEELGATVTWDDASRTVLVEKDNLSIFLRIGSYLVDYNHGEEYMLSDVAPMIINDRTYVPLRLISNAFGTGIDWIDETRTVVVDSSKTSSVQPFFDVSIVSHKNKDVISSETQVKIYAAQKYLTASSEIRILLLDPSTAKGFVVARGANTDSVFKYIPKPEDNGSKILVAAFYDASGGFIGGDTIAVDVKVVPEVLIEGVSNLGVIRDKVTINANINFPAYYVKYEIENSQTGKVQTFDKRDPVGSITWTPSMEQNGVNTIKATAYDSFGNPYESIPQSLVASVTRKLFLSGVSSGMTVNKPVSLIASRNFDVSKTEFLIKDIKTGSTSVLATIPYGSWEWFPGPNDSGEKDLSVRVTDITGMTHVSPVVRVTVDGSPRIIFRGIGPNQVLSSSANLSIKSNIQPESTRYILTDVRTGAVRYLGPVSSPAANFLFTSIAKNDGSTTIQAESTYQGNTILSEKISFTIYNGTIYGPKAIIAQNKFVEFASAFAVESMKKTGMSAALQMAQAILETGWGQSVPVDKYTGKFSYNLFGIKGTGTNGYVVSNTWEVYNGITYRIDANFRAYYAVEEGWEDHKSFLLTLSRYAGFRDVMYDGILGAWAIKHAGYATDPQYAIKLIRLIREYNLTALDLTGI
ncbi:MAG: stalk domain-containing protein [Clostridia bacterium]